MLQNGDVIFPKVLTRGYYRCAMHAGKASDEALCKTDVTQGLIILTGEVMGVKHLINLFEGRAGAVL